MSRPHELTPETLEALIFAFDAGATRDEAAEAAEVPRRTLFSWLERGKTEASGPFAELAEAAKITRMALRKKRRAAGRKRHRRRR